MICRLESETRYVPTCNWIVYSGVNICKDNQFKCTDGSCISDTKTCDGKKDCPNAADEIECENVQCHSKKWKCPTNVRIVLFVKCISAVAALAFTATSPKFYAVHVNVNYIQLIQYSSN